ncbi:MAG: DUF3617 domain-containing protein [Desulfuromonadales bacterium]|nr:DUF3617 domain-containing protein [Desulfuromonadales bacterium]
MLIAVFVIFPLAGQGWAENVKIRPGLWEHSFTIKSRSGEMESAMAQMQEQLASMPPAQRQMMEQMMAAQGVGVGSMGTSVKVCVTREMSEHDYVPQKDGDCKHQVIKRTGNTMKFRFDCAGDPPSSGEGEITMSNSKTYSGKTTVNTRVDGKPERMEMTQTGKWLSDDCGSIKPPRRLE